MLAPVAQLGSTLVTLAIVIASALALVFGGRVARWWGGMREAGRRVLAEDALKHIHNAGLRGNPATPDSLAGALGLSPHRTVNLIARLEAGGWLKSSAEGLSLTSEGSQWAVQVIRAHRLWERYLVDEARMPLERVHAEAERREHHRTADAVDALEASLGFPRIDPHGDPIPTARGELAELRALAITEWPEKTPGRIVHLEDEPPAIFARIAAARLVPGQTLVVEESTPERLVISVEGRTLVLPPIAGANVFVTPVEAPERRALPTPLTTLGVGQSAKVRGLDESLRGYTRRRLLDLGLTPGAVIKAEMAGIFADPVAYRVRGSLIALRREQARHVLIDPVAHGKASDG